MHVARGDAVALTRELVAIDSRNPSLVPNAPGEGAVARALGDVLRAWGFRVHLYDVAPGRPNVVARVGGDGTHSGDAALMFNGHIDVVDVAGMVHAPWDSTVRDGRIYGRGSSDMKAGVAAMCAAAARAADEKPSHEIIVTAVADEEFASLGTRALIAQGTRAKAAIVTEPTGLAIMPAHRGFVWADVVTHGRAAHGSRWDIGVDAIRHAGLVLAELDRFDSEQLPKRKHPLLGRPSIHASLIEGGAGMSTYPDKCTLRLERRTIPGESPDQVQHEIEGICQRAGRGRSDFRADVAITLAQEPSDVLIDAPIVRALADVLRGADEQVRMEGMSAWTDAALLNGAGIPAICFGPGDMSIAHSDEEWVVVDEIERATRVLTGLALTWSGEPRD